MSAGYMPGAVVMAVYRPDSTLFERQVRSLMAQTVTDWTCIVGIDGPDPETRRLVDSLCGADSRFQIHDFESNVGVYRHFERLLRLVPSTACWVSLADQDDHWYPEKFEKLLPALEEPHVAAVQGQARIVDAAGSVLGDTRRRPGNVVQTLLRNQLTGSFAIIDRRVLDDAFPFPGATEVAIHDHWLATCAASIGRIELVDRVLQDYVQHGSNVLGEAGPPKTRRSLREIRAGGGLVSILDDVTVNHWGWRVAMASALGERQGLGSTSPWVRGIARGRLGWAVLFSLSANVLQRRVPVKAALGFLLAAGRWPFVRPADTRIDSTRPPSAP
jgi:glycosyl transferase family 2